MKFNKTAPNLEKLLVAIFLLLLGPLDAAGICYECINFLGLVLDNSFRFAMLLISYIALAIAWLTINADSLT